ncbi:MAG: hypothetical protein FWC43_11015 [Planctomycetaceae bacterium]|nr:hypothetical protein [Planctomycetaceae bacterium]
MPAIKEKKTYSATPNYITLTPVGETISEKMFEMGIDEAELAKRCELSEDTIQKLLRAEIPLTPEIAKRIETATWMSADLLLRLDERYYKNLAFHKDHPEYPVL